MGQKVHPYGFRLGYTKPWKSRWFAERDYDKQLHEDVMLKAELKDKLKSAGVSAIEIERPGNKLRIIIKTARPGIIIGRKGAEIDKLKAELQKRTGGKDIFVDIQEVHKPELDAQLVSEAIALPLDTLRADIDYGFTEARTTYGVIGVKCWVYKGEILQQKKREPQAVTAG